MTQVPVTITSYERRRMGKTPIPAEQDDDWQESMAAIDRMLSRLRVAVVDKLRAGSYNGTIGAKMSVRAGRPKGFDIFATENHD